MRRAEAGVSTFGGLCGVCQHHRGVTIDTWHAGALPETAENRCICGSEGQFRAGTTFAANPSGVRAALGLGFATERADAVELLVLTMDALNHRYYVHSPIRRCLRIPCRKAMFYRVINGELGREEIAHTCNISLRGCMFTTSQPVEIEEFLELRFAIQYGVIFADGMVVFSNRLRLGGYEVGVRFIRLLPGDRFLLEDAIPALRRSEWG